MKVKVAVSKRGKLPTQGYEDDFAWDVYTTKDVIIIPGTIGATMVPIGLKTEFDATKYGMFVSPRSSISKLPLIQANSVGIIEGTYRGQWQMPLRNGMVISGLTRDVLTLDNKKVVTKPLSSVSKGALDSALSQFSADLEVLNETLNKQVKEILFKTQVPSGTVFLPKGTRIAQAYLIPKETIEWEQVNGDSPLTETERGKGGFGSSGER